jgi:ESCRT-II complex subunit VPS25
VNELVHLKRPPAYQDSENRQWAQVSQILMAISDLDKSTNFVFPKTYSFPPFFTPQPNALTRQSQLRRWSSLIQAYCRHYRIFKLSLVDALETPLFHNAALKKRLSIKDAKDVVDFMVSKEGEERAEWLGPDKSSCWIWWRNPDEWANLLAAWVDDTGQKGTVLTLYELIEGDTTENQEFHGMDPEVLRKSLNTLVKKGKAQVFGSEDQQGVKFF